MTDIKAAKEALNRLSLDTFYLPETNGPRNVLRLFINDVEALQAAPALGMLPWTVTHNGQSVAAETLSRAVILARKLRTPEEEAVANKNLQDAIAELQAEPEEFEIIQDDMQVASASGPNAYEEIMRYAAQYAEDGPLEIFQITRKRIDV